MGDVVHISGRPYRSGNRRDSPYRVLRGALREAKNFEDVVVVARGADGVELYFSRRGPRDPLHDVESLLLRAARIAGDI
jgi:hypothetical protein